MPEDIQAQGMEAAGLSQASDTAEVKEAVEQATAEVADMAAKLSTVGLGVDIVEIARVKEIISKTPHFKERNFTEEERAYCEGKSNPNTHFALHFAAKEAVLKALGTGFSDGIGVTDVQVGHDRRGKPFVILQGRAAEIAAEQRIDAVYLSLSYTHTTGVASAVAARKEHVPVVEDTLDARKELANQFKEMRSILDDIDAKLSEIESSGPSDYGEE